jgi:hypothetical protein
MSTLDSCCNFFLTSRRSLSGTFLNSDQFTLMTGLLTGCKTLKHNCPALQCSFAESGLVYERIRDTQRHYKQGLWIWYYKAHLATALDSTLGTSGRSVCH